MLFIRLVTGLSKQSDALIPEGGSRQEIADIPGFAAPPGDAHRARGSLIFVPPQHADCNASATFSSSVQQVRRRPQSQSLRNLGTEADVEVCFADPHPVQDAGKLARHRDDRAQHARPLGDPQAPRPQCRPFPDPQQKACSRLAQRLPNGCVALLADPSFIVDGRSRLMSSRRQTKMRSNRSRPRKASGIIDPDFGGNGTQAPS
jgi:hypothetical protein